MASTDVHSDAGSAVARLRAATRTAHEAVDAAFGRFDLSDRDGYRAFLVAHARALPVAEALALSVPLDPAPVPRAPLLAADLADLGAPMPEPLTFAPRSDAARWGILYVVEGSRLGGAMLAKAVPPGLPHRYLAAAHPAGQWRALRTAIDAAGEGKDEPWHAAMLDAALACFRLYERAAAA